MLLPVSCSICHKIGAEQNGAEICSLLYTLWQQAVLKNEKDKTKKRCQPTPWASKYVAL